MYIGKDKDSKVIFFSQNYSLIVVIMFVPLSFVVVVISNTITNLGLFVHRYSSCKAFKAMLCEVNDLAGQHEVIAENLQSDVIGKIICLVKEIKEERKKVNKNKY